MSVSEFDRQEVARIMNGHGTWFTAQLLRLCAKADSSNLERIRQGFPDVVALFEEWRRG